MGKQLEQTLLLRRIEGAGRQAGRQAVSDFKTIITAEGGFKTVYSIKPLGLF